MLFCQLDLFIYLSLLSTKQLRSCSANSQLQLTRNTYGFCDCACYEVDHCILCSAWELTGVTGLDRSKRIEILTDDEVPQNQGKSDNDDKNGGGSAAATDAAAENKVNKIESQQVKTVGTSIQTFKKLEAGR